MMTKSELILEVYSALSRRWPKAKTELEFSNEWEFVVSAILSAQATDKSVNKVTKKLFKLYPTPESFVKAGADEIRDVIKGINYYFNKGRYLVESARIYIQKFNKKLPLDVKEMTVLPGVGRKVANVILNILYNHGEGMVVDTHVARLSQRLGLSSSKGADKIEKDLLFLVASAVSSGSIDEMEAKNIRNELPNKMVFHGRYVCMARNPRCADCVLSNLCPANRERFK